MTSDSTFEGIAIVLFSLKPQRIEIGDNVGAHYTDDESVNVIGLVKMLRDFPVSS